MTKLYEYINLPPYLEACFKAFENTAFANEMEKVLIGTLLKLKND
jgi:hypothetical protein